MMPPNAAPVQSGSAVVFEDKASLALKSELDRLAPSDASLLLVGETGTGKEQIARYIHEQSRRRSNPFIAVNCGALPETLVEAEFFGYEKGVFTGAVKAQVGWFEAANRGTLLLNEVGDLPAPLGVKLLRDLQERKVVRLGARTSVKVDVRVIAATNVDLDAAIASGEFRRDLYFRLAVASVFLPALGQRADDIPVLADHFLSIYRQRSGRPDLKLGETALSALMAYPRSGNIRGERALTRYMLDMNIISDLIRNPQGRAARQIVNVGEDNIRTSIIVAAELRYGCAQSGSKRLLKAVEDLLAEINVLPFDVPTDADYGGIRSMLEAARRPIAGNDLLIAAHVYTTGATIVTANTAGVKRIPGLNVENWLA